MTQNRFLWIRTSPGQGEEGEDGEDADADVAAARWETQWIPSALLRVHGLIPDTVQNAKAFSGTVVRTVSMLASWIPNLQALPDSRIAIDLTWIFMILDQHLFSCLLTVALGLGIAVPAFQTSYSAL